MPSCCMALAVLCSSAAHVLHVYVIVALGRRVADARYRARGRRLGAADDAAIDPPGWAPGAVSAHVSLSNGPAMVAVIGAADWQD